MRLNQSTKNSMQRKWDKNFTNTKSGFKNILLFSSDGLGMREHTTVKYTNFLVKIYINNYVEILNTPSSAVIAFNNLNYKKNF